MSPPTQSVEFVNGEDLEETDGGMYIYDQNLLEITHIDPLTFWCQTPAVDGSLLPGFCHLKVHLSGRRRRASAKDFSSSSRRPFSNRYLPRPKLAIANASMSLGPALSAALHLLKARTHYGRPLRSSRGSHRRMRDAGACPRRSLVSEFERSLDPSRERCPRSTPVGSAGLTTRRRSLRRSSGSISHLCG